MAFHHGLTKPCSLQVGLEVTTAPWGTWYTAQGKQTTFEKYLLVKLLSATGVQLALGAETPKAHTQLEFHQAEDVSSLQQPKPRGQDRPMLYRRNKPQSKESNLTEL